MEMNKTEYIKDLEILYIKLAQKAEKEGLKGYDPRLYWYLPMAKRYFSKQTKLSNFLRRLEVAFCRFFPFLGIKYLEFCGIPKVVNPYGIGLLIQSYTQAYRYFNNLEYLDKAKTLESQLNQLLVRTRSGELGVSVPLEDQSVTNLPAGAEVAICYLDLYEVTKDLKYFVIAQSIALSFIQDHVVKITPNKGIAIDYYSNGDGSHVLNANALAAYVLNRVSTIENNERMNQIVLGIKKYLDEYILQRDLPYAGVEDSDKNKNWNYCDSYHTGFTLRAYGATWGFPMPVKDVLGNYLQQFLDNKDIISISNNNGLIDIHGVADFIKLYALLIGQGLDVLDNDLRLIRHNILFMKYKESFYYQRSVVKNSTYMPRWGHYPMMLAVSSLLIKLSSNLE